MSADTAPLTDEDLAWIAKCGRVMLDSRLGRFADNYRASRTRIAALESALAGIVARYDAGRASHGDTMVALGGAEAVAEVDGWIDRLRAVLEGRTP
jgi:hypothetical protein